MQVASVLGTGRSAARCRPSRRRRPWPALGFVLLLLGQLAWLGGTAAPASAQNTLRAAAVVNDEVISMLDLSMRTRLALLAAGLEATQENFARLQPQVLRSLIDERLQMQEAARLDIEVAEDEVRLALGNVAQQNNMTPEAFQDFLQRNSILPNVMADQVRAGLTWREVVNRRLRPTVEISDDEVDEQIARQQNTAGGEEFRVYEIFLAVDNVIQEQEVLATAQRLLQQLQSGAQFPAVARQVSQSPTAAAGGDLGWVGLGQLPEEVAQAVGQMQPGQVSQPINTFGGIYIVALRDRRLRRVGEVTVDLKQVLYTLPSGSGEAAAREALAKAQQARGQIGSCADADLVARQAGSQGSGDIGSVALNDLPDQLRQIVSNLQIGVPSEPVRLSGGIGVLVVCGRDDGTINRDKILEDLAQQRIDMLARRYIRDLRRSANVDVRL